MSLSSPPPPSSPSASTPILPVVVDLPAQSAAGMAPSPLQTLLDWDKDTSYTIFRKYSAPRLPHLILEFSGHGVPWLLIPILVFLFKSTLSPTAAALLLNFLALTVLDLIVIALLKPLFHRKRPAYNSGIAHLTVHAVDQFSFPSGHATRAGFLASFVCFVRVKHRSGLHPIIDTHFFTLLVLIWAIAVCASRVALGRHHVLDVVCGAIIGASYVFWWNHVWISDQLAEALRTNLRGMLAASVRLASFASRLQSQP